MSNASGKNKKTSRFCVYLMFALWIISMNTAPILKTPVRKVFKNE
jgi:hypothetical protein